MNKHCHNDSGSDLIIQHQAVIEQTIKAFEQNQAYMFTDFEHIEITQLLQSKLSKLLITQLPASLNEQQISNLLTDILVYEHDAYLVKCAPKRLLQKHRKSLYKSIEHFSKAKYKLDKQAQKYLFDIIELKLIQKVSLYMLSLQNTLPSINSILHTILQQLFAIHSKKIHQELDLHLLTNAPDSLVVKYSKIIEQTSKHLSPKDCKQKDVAQIVKERLLKKVRNKQWQGTYKAKNGASFETYFTSVIKHETKKCIQNKLVYNSFYSLEILDKKYPAFDIITTLQHHPTFQLHLSKIHLYLTNNTKDSSKVELCLKVMYGIPLTMQRLMTLYPHCSEHLLQIIINDFGEQKKKRNKRQLRENLNIFLPELEQEMPTTVGNLRKWIARQRINIWEVIFQSNIDVKSLNTESSKIVDWYFEILLHFYYKK